MNKNNKHNLVPKLRFPEFQNAGEWEVKKLGEVFKSFSGGTPDTSKKEYYNGKIPFIRSAEIGKDSTELFITETGLENSSAKMVKKGDLLVALYGANSGEVAISKIDGAINQAILCFQSEYSNEFTYHFLSGKKNWIVSKYVQGGQGNLSGEIVKSISLPFPSKSEQEKIASCLSSLDEVITGEQQKLELLKQHKKGLLQNLFPQEGETVPKLRFKEFENSGEWEVKRVGDVFDLTDGFPFSSSDFSDYDANSKQVIRITDINNKNKNEDKVYISIRRVKELKIEKYVVSKGDLLLSLTGAAGFNFFIWNYEEGYINQRTMKLSPKNIENKALIILLEPLIHKKINAIGTGQNNNLSKEALKDILFPFPKPNEQQKIASCLSSLDEIITAQTQKIEQLQRHKKGLLQGLFPNMNEHHG